MSLSLYLYFSLSPYLSLSLYSQVEFESREALLAERRESEEHCKLLLLAQREKNKNEQETRWTNMSFNMS